MRFRGFRKTRDKIFNAVSVITGRKKIDSDTIEKFEEELLLCDIGYDLTEKIVDAISLSVDKDIKPRDLIKHTVREFLSDISYENKLESSIIMISGVNGTGKTTSCAKLSNYYKLKGKKVCIIAADTFRAAAIEQIEYWAKKNNIDCFSSTASSDPSSIIFEGLSSDISKKSDITIIDTAGRLHTSLNLMSELSKMERVVNKFQTCYESWVSIDATSGQNALNQIDLFKKSLNVNGVILNKMDGSAKGGIAIPIMKNYQVPIKFIGVGEKDLDILEFSLEDYLEDLFGEED